MKSLIDAWLYAQRDEVNMFGDARGTKYEHGTPLKNEDGTKRNDKYAYVKWRRSDAPWIARFPKHWGEEPRQQTRDYVKLPGAYGFGSGTLKRWIEENMAEDEAAAAKEAAAAAREAEEAAAEAAAAAEEAEKALSPQSSPKRPKPSSSRLTAKNALGGGMGIASIIERV